MRRGACFVAALFLLVSALGCARRAAGPAPRHSAVRYCAMCGMACHERCATTITLPDGSARVFCCPHCAITQMSLPAAHLPTDVHVTLTDWDTRRPFAAEDALVVVESDIVPCCNPALICFADRAAAESFSKEHHGKIVTWDECLARPKAQHADHDGRARALPEALPTAVAKEGARR